MSRTSSRVWHVWAEFICTCAVHDYTKLFIDERLLWASCKPARCISLYYDPQPCYLLMYSILVFLAMDLYRCKEYSIIRSWGIHGQRLINQSHQVSRQHHAQFVTHYLNVCSPTGSWLWAQWWERTLLRRVTSCVCYLSLSYYSLRVYPSMHACVLTHPWSGWCHGTWSQYVKTRNKLDELWHIASRNENEHMWDFRLKIKWFSDTGKMCFKI